MNLFNVGTIVGSFFFFFFRKKLRASYKKGNIIQLNTNLTAINKGLMSCFRAITFHILHFHQSINHGRSDRGWEDHVLEKYCDVIIHMWRFQS